MQLDAHGQGEHPLLPGVPCLKNTAGEENQMKLGSQR